MTRSKILFYVLACFIAGVLIASFVNVPRLIVYEFFILAGLYLGLAFRQKKPEFKTALFVFVFCLLFLGLGILRTEAAKADLGRRPGGDYISAGASANLSNFLRPLKNKLRGIIFQNFSPPRSSILAALTLGDKRYIPDSWKEKLNRAGVRHITAVSGLHIVIISNILLWLGIAIGLYRGQAFYFALFFVWLFIFLIGFQPSAVRAGIMGSLLLFCQKIGRQRAADRALFLTAALMLAFNPLLLRGSVGFQLSFLASLGIIYLMPVLKTFFEKFKIAKIGGMDSLLAMTLSAQMFVLPVLIYNFGRFSLISPFTNILIVPLLPFIMTLGFAFLFAGLLWPGLGLLFSFPLFLLLSYLTAVVDFFSRLPLASLSLAWPWMFIPLYYIILLRFNRRLWYNLKYKKI